jgi:hypothetical protein
MIILMKIIPLHVNPMETTTFIYKQKLENRYIPEKKNES